MRPLIVSATHAEIANSIPLLDQHHIPYLITGVGMVATSYALSKELSNNQYDYIINIGIAGAIDRTLQIGQIIEIETDIFSELGAENDQEFIAIDELGFGQAAFSKIEAENLETLLPKVIGITVNTTHGCDSSIEKIKKIFPHASVESMEGAAFFYVCNQFNIASTQVRAISNYVEKRDKSTWNIPIAIKNLNEWLQSYLQNIINC